MNKTTKEIKDKARITILLKSIEIVGLLLVIVILLLLNLNTNSALNKSIPLNENEISSTVVTEGTQVVKTQEAQIKKADFKLASMTKSRHTFAYKSGKGALAAIGEFFKLLWSIITFPIRLIMTIGKIANGIIKYLWIILIVIAIIILHKLGILRMIGGMINRNRNRNRYTNHNMNGNQNPNINMNGNQNYNNQYNDNDNDQPPINWG